MVDKSIEEILEYLEGEGQIAIFDGSNLTKSRREHIMELIKDHVRFTMSRLSFLAYHQYAHLD